MFNFILFAQFSRKVFQFSGQFEGGSRSGGGSLSGGIIIINIINVIINSMKWGRQADIRQRNRQIDRMSDGLAAIGELSNYDNNHRHVHQRVTIGLVYGTCMYDRKPMKIVMI